MEAKKVAYTTLVKSLDEEVKRRNMETYKTSRKETKLVVWMAKKANF